MKTIKQVMAGTGCIRSRLSRLILSAWLIGLSGCIEFESEVIQYRFDPGEDKLYATFRYEGIFGEDAEELSKSERAQMERVLDHGEVYAFCNWPLSFGPDLARRALVEQETKALEAKISRFVSRHDQDENDELSPEELAGANAAGREQWKVWNRKARALAKEADQLQDFDGGLDDETDAHLLRLLSTKVKITNLGFYLEGEKGEERLCGGQILEVDDFSRVLAAINKEVNRILKEPVQEWLDNPAEADLDEELPGGFEAHATQIVKGTFRWLDVQGNEIRVNWISGEEIYEKFKQEVVATKGLPEEAKADYDRGMFMITLGSAGDEVTTLARPYHVDGRDLFGGESTSLPVYTQNARDYIRANHPERIHAKENIEAQFDDFLAREKK